MNDDNRKPSHTRRAFLHTALTGTTAGLTGISLPTLAIENGYALEDLGPTIDSTTFEDLEEAIEVGARFGVPVQLPPGRLDRLRRITGAPMLGEELAPGVRNALQLFGTGKSSINPVLGSPRESFGSVVDVSQSIEEQVVGIELNSTRDVRLRDMSLVGPGKEAEGSVGILIRDSNVGARIENVSISGFETAVQFGDSPQTGYVSRNDDQTTFRDSYFENCKVGVRAWGLNSFALRFTDCTWLGTVDRLLVSELWNTQTIPGASKSDVWIDGGFAGCPEGLALLQRGNGGVLRIDKLFYEPSAPVGPMVEAIGSAFSTFSVHIDSCMLSFGNACFSPLIAMDGRGLLTMTRNRISHGRPILEFRVPFFGTFAADLSNNDWTRRPSLFPGDIQGVNQRNEVYRSESTAPACAGG